MSESNPSRRDLLTGQPLRGDVDPDESTDSSSNAPAAAQSAIVREESYVEHLSKSAMGCQFEFVFNAGQYSQAADIAMQAFELIDALEDQLTVYRDYSEVSRLNRAAARDPVRVEAGLFSLLMLSRRLHALTDGAFDITAAELSRIWGFSRREGRVPSKSEIDGSLQHVGMDHVHLDQQRQTVQFDDDRVAINLGGIGKGFTVDRCAEHLEQHGLDHFLIHGGQSSIVARGERSGVSRRGRTGWVIGICHPVWPKKRLGEIELSDQALGTSGTGRQSFFYQGKRYGHILDPRTGHPAEEVLQSTVIAPTAAEADALATACYVLGVDRTEQVCKRRPDVGAILVTAATQRGAIEIHSFGVSPKRWSRTID